MSDVPSREYLEGLVARNKAANERSQWMPADVDHLEPADGMCEVIGCDPRPAVRYMKFERVHACERCGSELDELAGRSGA